MNKLWLLALAAAIAVIAFAVPRDPKADLGPTLEIGRERIGVEIANTPELRMQGLSGRDFLAADQGMLFEFDTPAQYRFWMRGMRFDLDFIWIAQGQVAEITPNVPTEGLVADDKYKIYSPQVPVDAMLETNAGWAALHGIRVGDQVRLWAP